MADEDQPNSVDLPGSSAGSNNNQIIAALNSIMSNNNHQNQVVVHSNLFTGLPPLAQLSLNFGSLNPQNFGINLLNFAEQLAL